MLVRLMLVVALFALLLTPSPSKSHGDVGSVRSFEPPVLEVHSVQSLYYLARIPAPPQGPPIYWRPMTYIPHDGEVCDNVPYVKRSTGRVGKFCERWGPIE